MHGAEAEKLGITFNTLALLDADQKLLAADRVHGLYDSAAIVKWLKDSPGIIKAVATAEAGFKAKTDNETRYTLAKACDDAGLWVEAETHYKQLAADLPKGDKRRIEVQFRRAEFFEAKWDTESSGKLFAEVYPALIEAKDERAIRASAGMVAQYSNESKFKEAREVLLKVAQVFPANDQAQQGKISAAWYAALAGDKKTAVAELKAIIAAGKAEDWLVQSATYMLQSVEAMEDPGDKEGE